jgi:hypothetical protein
MIVARFERLLRRQRVPRELIVERMSGIARHFAPVIDRTGWARRNARVASVADRGSTT